MSSSLSYSGRPCVRDYHIKPFVSGLLKENHLFFIILFYNCHHLSLLLCVYVSCLVFSLFLLILPSFLSGREGLGEIWGCSETEITCGWHPLPVPPGSEVQTNGYTPESCGPVLHRQGLAYSRKTDITNCYMFALIVTCSHSRARKKVVTLMRELLIFFFPTRPLSYVTLTLYRGALLVMFAWMLRKSQAAAAV